VLAVIGLLSLRVGSVPLSTGDVVGAFTDFDGSNPHLIVRTLRLPRTLIGIAVGAALAVAGVLLQGLTRNPLAAPEILGVNAGAAFGVVTALHVLGGLSAAGYVWFAFAGALGALTVAHVIGSAGRGGATPVKLALAGVVVTALLSSWTSAVLVLDQRTLDEVRFWLAGSIAGRDLAPLVQVLPALLAGLVLAFALARQLDALSLGDEVARGLGQRTAAVRVGCTVAVVLLAGASVAVAGPVSFVGLAVPHLARAFVGARHRRVLPHSAVAGAALLVSADVIGRVVAPPAEVQVGIVTALLGAPFLVHLARRRAVVAP
jgi:iron complex transport system permease protein